MVDMATILREQIYSAVRAFTCSTVAEAEAATKAIIRLVDNALPDDGTCVRCGAAATGYKSRTIDLILWMACAKGVIDTAGTLRSIEGGER